MCSDRVSEEIEMILVGRGNSDELFSLEIIVGTLFNKKINTKIVLTVS
jgi:hypothetical protein